MVFHLDSGYMQRDCNNLLASNLVSLTAQRNITAAMHVRVSNSNSNSSGGLVPLPCPRGRDYHSNLVVGLYKSLRLSIEEVLGALLVSVPFQGKIMPYCNPPWAASMPFF